MRLIGHDWGGWVGFLICLREPERVKRYLALNIAPPFVRVDLRTVLSVWRFWYQWVIASPLGPRIVSQSGPIGRAAFGWVGSRSWSTADSEIFLGRLREPERARASALYYRTFQRELLALVRGRYRRARLRTPTRILFGTGDQVLTRHYFDAVHRHADDIEVEFVPGTGHFIADEKPGLVLERAQTFFA